MKKIEEKKKEERKEEETKQEKKTGIYGKEASCVETKIILWSLFLYKKSFYVY